MNAIPGMAFIQGGF